MSDQNARLLELIARIEAALAELRDQLDRPPQASDGSSADDELVRAFADETFRARDA